MKYAATLILLMSSAFAQNNPTWFINSSKPNPSPTAPTYSFDVLYENGKPVGQCPPNSAGCIVSFNGSNDLSLTLPDIANDYVNHATIACTIVQAYTTGKYGCSKPYCQSVSYRATGDTDGDIDDLSCKDANGQVWTVHTTQFYHWIKSGRTFTRHYDGGFGFMIHP